MQIMKDTDMGTVYWISGLFGAGKTTIGNLFFKCLREEQKNVLFLDGDTLREIFGNDTMEVLEQRKGKMVSGCAVV